MLINYALKIAIKLKKFFFSSAVYVKLSFFFKALSEADCPVCAELKKTFAPDYFTGQFDVPANMRYVTRGHPHYYKFEYFERPGGRIEAIRRFLEHYEYRWIAHDDGSGIVHNIFVYIGKPDNIHPPMLIGTPDLTLIDKQLALASELKNNIIANELDRFFNFLAVLESKVTLQMLLLCLVMIILLLVFLNSRNIAFFNLLIDSITHLVKIFISFCKSGRSSFNKMCDKRWAYLLEELHYLKKNYYIWKFTWIVKKALVRFVGKILLFLRRLKKK